MTLKMSTWLDKGIPLTFQPETVDEPDFSSFAGGSEIRKYDLETSDPV